MDTILILVSVRSRAWPEREHNNDERESHVYLTAYPIPMACRDLALHQEE